MTPHRMTGRSLPRGVNQLARFAASEKFGMVNRLISDFRDGSNTFSKDGESLWILAEDSHTIAVGGVNVDPYFDLPTVGRIRHLYVHPQYRRTGVGRKLLQSIEHSGMGHFEVFQLFTGDAVASRFYEALGYSRVEGQWKVSHAKRVAA